MTDKQDLQTAGFYEHFTEVTIRYCDQDPMGHVNNIAIAAYIEAARTSYIYDLLMREGKPAVEFVLAGLNINFHREFHWPGTVRVGARITSVGNRSFVSGYGVFIGDVCHVTATCVSVFFDMATRKSTEPPAQIRSLLESECPKEKQKLS